MAGPFAHMCVVDALSRPRNLFAGLGQIGEIISFAIEKQSEFCELGCVSPDLPYLDLLEANSKGWANVMHYWKTSDMLRAGVAYFATKDLATENDDNLKALAWLFGYAAHVATDLTIHPVLAASGYPYATNPSGHRHCEMHQDAYIFRKLNAEDPSEVHYIENCGIASCHAPNDRDKLHPAIGELWRSCLAGISPTDVQIENGTSGPTSGPTPDTWFHDYTERLAEFVEQGGGFCLFFRELLVEEGLTLPASGEIDLKYITALKTPSGQPTHYDQVFASAVANVSNTWKQLAQAIAGKNEVLFALKNADLDTGEADDNQQQIFPC